jgi:hypothetical protein
MPTEAVAADCQGIQDPESEPSASVREPGGPSLSSGTTVIAKAHPKTGMMSIRTFQTECIGMIRNLRSCTIRLI